MIAGHRRSRFKDADHGEPWNQIWGLMWCCYTATLPLLLRG